jgi:pimeloyl-ACP methyl ester carboxylesterase
MVDLTFKELYSRLEEFFRAGDLSSALDLATEGRELFPEHGTILDYWRFSLLARTNSAEESLDVLQSAIDSGSWYSDIILRRSSSLQALQGDPRFEDLIIKNHEAAEHDQASQYPFYTMHPRGKCQSGEVACPLLIGLHTNGGSAQDSIDFWKPAAELGWLVAVPQSSQALMKGAYVWDDRQIAEREIHKDFDTLTEHYSVNPWQTVLAGHGLGGETAIWLALKGSLEVKSFLAIGPAGPMLDQTDGWEKLMIKDRQFELRGYIIADDMDNLIQIDQITLLVEALNQTGIETELEIISGADHEFEPAYEAAIKRGLNFLTG